MIPLYDQQGCKLAMCGASYVQPKHQPFELFKG